MATPGTLLSVSLNGDSGGLPPPRRPTEPVQAASKRSAAAVSQLHPRRVALVTACPRFAQRMRRDCANANDLALRVEPVPEAPTSVHRLACDCAASVLIVDGSLFEVGRVLPGDAAIAPGKDFHLLLAFPSVDRASVDVALQTRARGCIEFDIPSPQLARAIAVVAKGELWFPRWMARSFYERAMATAPPASPQADEKLPDRAELSVREVEVMHFVRRGMTNKEVARELCISPNTVKKHVHSALRKLGLIHRRQVF